MNAISLFSSLNRDQRNTFIASFLGWMLDAFDFFLVTFVTLRIAKDFNVGLPAVAFAVSLTLMLRPVGALIFGLLADRFGRRIPLMVDIICYSILELLTAFSPNFIVFLLLRGLFGVAMGGEWGLGSSLAMESLPTESRGLFSGILQQGYACGYLLAAIVYFLIFTFFPSFGWRGMFIVGALPALLVVFMRVGVRESPVWEHQQALHRERGTNVWTGMANVIQRHWILFLYLIVLMTSFNALSHGTQDNLPTFLQAQLKLGVNATSTIAIISNIGAIIGGTLFGFYSQRWGRRKAIIIACILGIIMIPFWSSLIRIPGLPLLVSIAIGAFLLQFMVQGAWGVIPVHLNELSPTDVRGTFPGFAYQLGNLFAAYIVFFEAVLAQKFGTSTTPNYAVALAIFSLGAFIAVIVFTAIGREARGIEFTKADERDVVYHDGSSSSGGEARIS
jgi:MFS transporter, SHS family, lactate transporter